jgi:threonine aldolase
VTDIRPIISSGEWSVPVSISATRSSVATAAALVYENRWAAPFASALRRAGGQLVADGRIPIQSILASIEAEESAEREGA